MYELTERERHTPEWHAVAAGGLRVLPVAEFRLSTLPKPLHNDDSTDPEANKVDFKAHVQSRKDNKIDRYPLDLTEDDLEKEIDDQFRKLKAEGFSDKDAETEVFKTKKKQYEALQSWKDTNAEITTK